MLEEEGIATVVIATEVFEKRLTSMKLPRILFTSYPMGRPLGYPNQQEAQEQILKEAFKLLEESKDFAVKYFVVKDRSREGLSSERPAE